MKVVGPYLIIRKSEFPAFEKAHRLARCLSHNDIEEILDGKRHVHKNPRKWKVPVSKEEMSKISDMAAAGE